jgi:hypothetical protein
MPFSICLGNVVDALRGSEPDSFKFAMVMLEEQVVLPIGVCFTNFSGRFQIVPNVHGK